MTLRLPQYLLATLVLLSGSQKWVKTAPINSTGIEFIILHNNDMHARFEQTGVYGNECLPKDIASNNCYGGFARVAHEVRKFREEAAKPAGTPVIYLNAGDTYTGTPWFYVYKDNITAEFMNVLQPDAISLGNHEFDDGVEGLVPFLDEAKFPVLVANLDLTNQPKMAAARSLKPSVVLDVHGTKVGVIGYLTPDTTRLSLVPSLVLNPEVMAINEEAQKLKSQGVNIIIALGHSGYETDQEIGRKCPLVDIVIGGHSHSLLYSGQAPSVEKVEGPYPTIVEQIGGKKVPIVQAYAYTKYLGHMRVKFNQTGDLLEWDGKPILLNGQVPEDSDVLQLLNSYRPGVKALQETKVGNSAVFLDGDSKNCREKECNLGNMITDAFVLARSTEFHLEPQEYWTDAAIAFVQGGGIRSSITPAVDGSITKSDLITTLPFNSKLVVTQVTGKTIRDMMEYSVSQLGGGFGGFLQVSGIHAVFNISEPRMKRVMSIRVLCAKCEIPMYSDLEDEKNYNIIVTDFLLNGGDGHKIPHVGEKVLKALDVDAVEAYVKARSPVYPGVEWRLVYEGELLDPGNGGEDGGDGVGTIVASGLLIVTSLLMHLLR